MEEIRYRDKVKIVGGFFRGIKGIVIEFGIVKYLVQFMDTDGIPTNKSEWIKRKDLEIL